MDSPSSTRRPCFIEEKPSGLASIVAADMDSPSFSGHQLHHHHQHHHNHLLSRPIYPSAPLPRRGSLRNLSYSFSSVSSPRSGRFYDGRFEEQQPHFLDSCFLCKKPIGDNRDIFMYRGDTPFCSEECREEQIEKDEAKEKKWNLKASMKAMRNKEETKKSANKNTQDYPFHSGAGAVAAA